MYFQLLFYGVGYDKCTAMHLAEAKQEHIITCLQGSVMENGWTEFIEMDYNDSDFVQIGQAYEKENKVQSGKIGEAMCRVLNLRSIVDYAQMWMQNNRHS